MEQFTIEYDEESSIYTISYRGVSLFNYFSYGEHITIDEALKNYDPQSVMTFMDAAIDGHLFDYFMNNTFAHSTMCMNTWGHMTNYIDMNEKLYTFTDTNGNILTVKRNDGYEFTHNNKSVLYKYDRCMMNGIQVECVCGMCNIIIRNVFYKSVKSAK